MKFERILPGRLTKLTYCKDGAYEENEINWTNKRQSQKHMGKVWIGQTFFKLKQEDEPAEEVPREPNPEVVGEEGFPMGYSTRMKKNHKQGCSRRRQDQQLKQPVRREIVEHPNAVDEGQAGEPRAQEVLAPRQPTPEERAQHELHHANFEPWCEKSFMGQGRDKPHRRQEEPKEHTVYADYMFSTKEGEVQKADPERNGS